MGIALYALALGAVWLGLSARLLLLLGRRLGGSFSGWVAALMFLLCGPLLWGYYSGMAIGLFACSILLTLYLYLAEDRRAPLAAVLLALVRPEGIVLVLPADSASRLSPGVELAVGGAFGSVRAPGPAVGLVYGGGRGIWGRGQMALCRTPRLIARANQSHFLRLRRICPKGSSPGRLGIRPAPIYTRTTATTAAWCLPRFIALFFLAELSYRLWSELSERKLGVAALGGAWFVGGVLLTCTLVEYDAHFNRYQQPFLPLYILFAALGLGRLDEAGGEWGRKLARGLACFFGLWGLMSVGFFAVAYGENCSDIRNQQVEMARFIDAELPPDARIAVNDAGALRYFSRRQTIDLVGLTTAGNSGALAARERVAIRALGSHAVGPAPAVLRHFS